MESCDIDPWVRCDDQLPDDDIDVLVHGPQMTGNPVWLAHYDGEIANWRWCDGKSVDLRITHWMHIPAPPR